MYERQKAVLRLPRVQVMAAHMVSIARREYESDWSWRDSSGAADPNPNHAAAAPARVSAGAAGAAREAEAGLRLGSEAQERSGGGGGATAVLEAPAQAAPNSNGATAAATGPATGDPVEPKRVLYSYYTVRLRTSLPSLSGSRGLPLDNTTEPERVLYLYPTDVQLLTACRYLPSCMLRGACTALPRFNLLLDARTALRCAH